MPEQPNKPGGDFREGGKVRKAEDEQAVRNQGEVSPDDYPDKASAKDSLGSLGE